ncbi:MAG: hypothetical protein Kow002_07820 [Anaerolineales bacterium]
MARSIFDVQAEFCKAMGNATRLKIMHILRDKPMTVSQIVTATSMNQSLISRQLSVLRSVGVVINERNGSEMIYRLTNEKIGEVCDLVQQVLLEQFEEQSNVLHNL